MESTPTDPEVQLNSLLRIFVQRVLDDDTSAMAIVRYLNKVVGATENMDLIGGEPSVFEHKDGLTGGIQIGYQKSEEWGNTEKFFYIDLFYFDSSTTTHKPTEILTGVVNDLAEEDRAAALEHAWHEWLGGMRDLVSSIGQPLFLNIYTGEVSLAQNIPLEHRAPLELPRQ